MFNKKGTLAIDIGSRYIKVVQGKKVKKGIRITGYGMCSSPLMGRFTDNGDYCCIVESINEIINGKGLKPKEAIVGIKGQDIIIKYIRMPVLKGRELEQAAQYEISQYLPIDHNDYVISSKKLGEESYEEGSVAKVLMVAAPKTKVDNYLKVAEQLKLKLRAIDICCNSITNFFKGHKSSDEGDTKCIGIIDIGYRSTTITLIEQGELFLQKEISIGTMLIDNKIEEAFQNETEDIGDTRLGVIWMNTGKRAYSNHDSRIYEANNKTRYIIDMLIMDIIKISNFYASTGPGRGISKFYLYGGGAMLNGIANYIGNSISVDTELFDESLLCNLYNTDAEFKQNIYLYLNCISLLLRRD